MHYNLRFYYFMRVLPTFCSVEDHAILDEVDIALQIGNKISATHISFDDPTINWHLC
jgi:hypothetical protein